MTRRYQKIDKPLPQTTLAGSFVVSIAMLIGTAISVSLVSLVFQLAER